MATQTKPQSFMTKLTNVAVTLISVAAAVAVAPVVGVGAAIVIGVVGTVVGITASSAINEYRAPQREWYSSNTEYRAAVKQCDVDPVGGVVVRHVLRHLLVSAYALLPTMAGITLPWVLLIPVGIITGISSIALSVLGATLLVVGVVGYLILS